MKVLILAAGMGNRLKEITANKPKALVDVAGIKLIDRVLDFLDHPRVSSIAVVGGYFFDRLKDHISNRNINIYRNENYKEGNLLSLLVGIDFLDDEFLMLNVDHIYPKKMLDHIIKNARGLSAICDFDRNLGEDDMKVKLDNSRRLKAVSKKLSDFDCGYIGMTYCEEEMVDKYIEYINKTFEIYGNEACVESVLDLMARNEVEINICDASGFKWLEVDTGEDLKNAEEKLLKG